MKHLIRNHSLIIAIFLVAMFIFPSLSQGYGKLKSSDPVFESEVMTITVKGKRKDRTNGTIRCKGKKGTCITADHVAGDGADRYIIKLFDENGEEEEEILVNSYEIEEGEEDGEVLTTITYDPVE